MPVENLIEEMSQLIRQFETEANNHAAQVSRGTDVFENSRAESFYDGKVEALTTVLQQLESLRQATLPDQPLHTTRHVESA